MDSRSGSSRHTYIIVGAGPAGLQLGYFLEKAGHDYLILESNERPASFFERYPRHKTLISINKRFNGYPETEFNLRHDWNSLLSDDESMRFTEYSQELFPSSEDLCRYMADFVERHSIKIRFETRVAKISRDADTGIFTLVDRASSAFSCERLVIATGAVKPNIPREIEGIEHALGYEDHDIDPTIYENKRVGIIGRGNSAFEVADHLAGSAAIVHLLVGEPIKHAWQTHYPGDLRAINNTILDMYQLKSLHAMVGFRPKKISKTEDGRLKVIMEEDYPHWDTPGTGTTTTYYDYIIRCTGWRFIDEELFDDSCRPECIKEGKYPQLSSSWESTVPDMFFIGTAMQARDRKAASGFIHGFRYNVRTLFNLMGERYHGVALPSKEFPLQNGEHLEELASFLIGELSTTSSLFQLFGFLCDVIVVSASGEAKIYFDLPKDYVLERAEFMDEEQVFLMTLEYGFHKYPKGVSTLDFIHPADASNNACSAYLHPVFRYYSRGEFVDEQHLGESLVVRYDECDYEENVQNMYKNNIKTIFNERFKLTDEEFSADAFTPEQRAEVFTPWSEEVVEEWRKKMKEQEDAQCQFVI